MLEIIKRVRFLSRNAINSQNSINPHDTSVLVTIARVAEAESRALTNNSGLQPKFFCCIGSRNEVYYAEIVGSVCDLAMCFDGII